MWVAFPSSLLEIIYTIILGIEIDIYLKVNIGKSGKKELLVNLWQHKIKL